MTSFKDELSIAMPFVFILVFFLCSAIIITQCTGPSERQLNCIAKCSEKHNPINCKEACK